MNFTLRPYQQDIYNKIPQQLKYGPVLVQAPARSGKSKIIAATVDRIISAGKIPVVLTHRGKIQLQLIEHCSGVSIDSNTDHVFITTGHCYVAMNQTLVKRPNIISQLSTHGRQVVLIIDEAHRGDFIKLFDMLPDAYRIGFTATPAYKWAKFLPSWYKSLIHGPQVSELVQSGNITPIEYYEMRNELDELKKGSNGEFTEQSQDIVFDRAKLYDGLFIELSKFKFNKCIVFCASKKAADALCIQFVQNGYQAVCYYSGKARFELAKFTDLDQANVLITVSALSEGFDCPQIDFNILWRATSSLPLFIQMAMRGATPHVGKHTTTVLDFGGNNSRFGGRRNIQALTMDRDWNALWQPPETPPKMPNGVSAVKICPACEFMISAMARSCSNCGYIYPEAEVKLKEGELIKIQHDAEVARRAALVLTGRRISTLSPTELATYARERNKKPLAMRVAKALTIKNGAQYIVDYGRAIGYKSGWAERELRNIAEIQMHQPDYKVEFFDVVVK